MLYFYILTNYLFTYITINNLYLANLDIKNKILNNLNNYSLDNINVSIYSTNNSLKCKQSKNKFPNNLCFENKKYFINENLNCSIKYIGSYNITKNINFLNHEELDICNDTLYKLNNYSNILFTDKPLFIFHELNLKLIIDKSLLNDYNLSKFIENLEFDDIDNSIIKNNNLHYFIQEFIDFLVEYGVKILLINFLFILIIIIIIKLNLIAVKKNKNKIYRKVETNA